MSGRIGALAVRNNGSIILGAAQGGVWTYDEDQQDLDVAHEGPDTQAVGALAVAPCDDKRRLPRLRRGRAVR